MKNFKKIKSMSLEEMAEFIKIDHCYYCKVKNCDNEDCIDTIKKWLQEESE